MENHQIRLIYKTPPTIYDRDYTQKAFNRMTKTYTKSLKMQMYRIVSTQIRYYIAVKTRVFSLKIKTEELKLSTIYVKKNGSQGNFVPFQ